MKVTMKLNDGVHFTATTESGHSVEIDGSPAIGGQDRGARPMETVLIGLGGCSAVDVMSLLRKMRQDVVDCEIVLDGARADAVPAVFTEIVINYTVTGHELDPAKVEKAVSLSVEKYCSVSRMLAPTVDIRHRVSVVQQ